MSERVRGRILDVLTTDEITPRRLAADLSESEGNVRQSLTELFLSGIVVRRREHGALYYRMPRGDEP